MSGFIPRDFINDLISRVNIVDIIEARIPLKKRGPQHIAPCPFHNEKTPSFNVSPQKQLFHCFGCGISGNVISFVMEYDRLDFVSAVESIASQLGIAVPTEQGSSRQTSKVAALYPIMEQANHFYQKQLRQHQTRQTAIDYLKQRGLSGEIVKHFQIGYAPAGWDNLSKALANKRQTQQLLVSNGLLISKDSGGVYDRFRQRIMFPIRDQRGRVIGFGGRVLADDTPKYLNSPETPLFHKGKELYGLYEALQSSRKLDQVLIVEGYMDVVALAQHGIRFAVATLGTSTSRDHIHSLLRYTKTITFCFDGDKAGRDAAWRALETSLALVQDGVQLRFLFLPDGEDPDSLVRKEGAACFHQRIKQSQLLSDVLLEKLSQQADLHSIDGRSRYFTLALPLIKQIPQGAFRHMLIEEIGRSLRLAPERVEQLLNEQRIKPAPQTTGQKKRRTPSTLRLVIALLLQEPSLIAYINDDKSIQSEQSAGYVLLQQLVQLLRNNSKLTTAHLLEHWRNDPHYSHLQQLASWQHHVPQTGIQEEFIDAWQSLEQQQLQRQIDDFMSIASQRSLSTEEKQRLQTLIQEKQQKKTAQE